MIFEILSKIQGGVGAGSSVGPLDSSGSGVDFMAWMICAGKNQLGKVVANIIYSQDAETAMAGCHADQSHDAVTLVFLLAKYGNADMPTQYSRCWERG
jgi:hypothetical protein